jgi:hypothetical protein
MELEQCGILLESETIEDRKTGQCKDTIVICANSMAQSVLFYGPPVN